MSIASVDLSPVSKDFLAVSSFLSSQHGHLTNDIILIYLTVAGSVVPIHVLSSDSVASVKFRIQTHKGFFVKDQKLVFDGRELSHNDSRVCDYGVTHGTVLHLVLRLPNLQAITVTTLSGEVLEFHVEKNRNVGYLKQQIAERANGLFDLNGQVLVCNGEELEDHNMIYEYCRDNDAIHLLVRKSVKIQTNPFLNDLEVLIVASNLNEKNTNAGNGEDTQEFQKQFCREPILEPLIVNPKIELPLVITQMVESTLSGLNRGHRPVRSCEGCGGAYFMSDSAGEGYISVFKPIDEEPMAVNNPRGLPHSKDGEGLKKGTQVGEGALREVAAYILDHPKDGRQSLYHGESGFSGVPPTALVKCLHEAFYHPNGYKVSPENMKIGSMQVYVKNIGSCEDMGPGSFPVEEVHKISVLDIRLANADRHAGNILVNRDIEGRITLIPIDHGYCLPSNFEDCTFDWLYWPQACQPYSTDTKQYIKSLDAEADIRLLKLHGWSIPPECARVFRVSTMLLKKGVERGMTVFSIGSIMCRETLMKESAIEKIVEEAESSLLPGSSESAFLEAVSLAMDRKFDELTLSVDTSIVSY